MEFAIAFPKHSNRPKYYEDKKATITWVPDMSLGTFARNVDAKKALLLAMQEIQPGREYADEFIRKMFRVFINTETAKIIRLK